MKTQEIGTKLVNFCKDGQFEQAIENLYDPNVTSVEAMAMGPEKPAEIRGRDKVLEKNKWWSENHDIHKVEIEGPFPNANQFAVNFTMDVTNKESGQRMSMKEVALYTVENDKITKEQFFYPTED